MAARRLTALAVLVVGVLGATAAVEASFLAFSEGSGNLTAAVLAPPSDLAGTPGACAPDATASMTLEWVATTSDWADGYEVSFGTAPGGPYPDTRHIEGWQTTMTTIDALEPATDYWFVVKAERDTWHSASSNEFGATAPSCP